MISGVLSAFLLSSKMQRDKDGSILESFSGENSPETQFLCTFRSSGLCHRRLAGPPDLPGAQASPARLLVKPRYPLCTRVFSNDAHVTVRTPRGRYSPQPGEFTEHPVTLETAFGTALFPSTCDLTA